MGVGDDRALSVVEDEAAEVAAGMKVGAGGRTIVCAGRLRLIPAELDEFDMGAEPGGEVDRAEA